MRKINEIFYSLQGEGFHTGTPAVFMHAADAIHGDLGMICHDDVVICISKSGNTPEIKVLVPLIRNVGNEQIVAMVSNTDSFLAKNAAYVLKAQVDREACPNNLFKAVILLNIIPEDPWGNVYIPGYPMYSIRITGLMYLWKTESVK